MKLFGWCLTKLGVRCLVRLVDHTAGDAFICDVGSAVVVD